MQKDYKNIKKKKTKPFLNQYNNALYFVTGLTIGLFVAVIIYFHEHNATVENSIISLHKTPIVEEKAKINDNKVITQLPELQFDFYKILPNKEINVSEWESLEEDVPSQTLTTQLVMYVFQIGSFKEFRAADEIKARLALMGITANIQRVVINGQDVRHRVRIGPYKDVTQLEQIKDRLLANDLDFMLLKLKREDS